MYDVLQSFARLGVLCQFLLGFGAASSPSLVRSFFVQILGILLL